MGLSISPLCLWPPFEPAPGTSDELPFYFEDPWVVLGYNATVAIEIDANAGGTVRDIHGVADPDWQVVPRYQSLRCALARTSGKGTPELVLAPGRPRAELGWKMLIGRPVALDNRHRLVLLDPDRGGRPRYLYVVRPTEDHFFNHKCWVAGLSEWYTSKG